MCDGGEKITYDVINNLMHTKDFSKEKMIRVSTNGVSSMVGNKNGFATFF